MTITTIGLDLAKSVFQARGVDESGATVLVKKLHRKQMLPFFSKLSRQNALAKGASTYESHQGSLGNPYSIQAIRSAL